MDKEKTLETLEEWHEAGMIMHENLPKLAEILSNQWISVEDKLPEYPDDEAPWSLAVNVLTETGWVTEGFYDRILKVWRIRGGWSIADTVTHWQSLPSAPEQT